MSHVISIRAFSDNYIWLVCDNNKKFAMIVDPVDGAVVVKTLKKLSIQPVGVLVTHFHSNHTVGIKDIIDAYPSIPVYGPVKENIPYVTNKLLGNELIKVNELDLTFKVINTFGHTAGHISYYTVNNAEGGKLFCGDTLLGAGCGRVLGGNTIDLYNSLQTISKLPLDTLIYCAHEYTLDNLKFAKWVEPDNKAIGVREIRENLLLDIGNPTTPFLLSSELETNPFMRVNEDHVIKRLEQIMGQALESSRDVFAAMRTWKDNAFDI